MPIYEYRCTDCGRRTSVLVRNLGAAVAAACESCGSEHVQRVMSRFAYHRSESDRLAELDTSKQPGEDYYRDSRNIGLWAKKRAKELGVDEALAPKFDEIVENAQQKTKDLLAD